MSPTAPLLDAVGTAYPFFDSAVLADLVGREVVPSGLRHKPGVSTTATLTTPDGTPWGWAQVLRGEQADKVANARRRAAARRSVVTVRPLPDRAGVLLHGRVGSDPRLHRGLEELAALLPDVDAALRAGALLPLRYNALRRLVVRGGEEAGPVPADRVVRIGAERRTLSLTALERLADLGVPLLAPDRSAVIAPTRHVTVWPWVTGSDLAAAPDRDAAHAAGAALARLHEVTTSRDGRRAMSRVLAGEGPEPALRRVVSSVAAVAPSLTPRLDDIVRRLGRLAWRPDRIVHGDFSADQVVVGREGIRIVDLDRLQLGEPLHDLAGFAAVELRRTGHWGLTPELLSGYRRRVDPAALTAWTAHALLLRLTEPFRAVSPTWRQDMDERMDEVEVVLREGVVP